MNSFRFSLARARYLSLARTPEWIDCFDFIGCGCPYRFSCIDNHFYAFIKFRTLLLFISLQLFVCYCFPCHVIPFQLYFCRECEERQSAIKCSAYKRLFSSIRRRRSNEMKHLLGKISFDLFVSIYEEIMHVNTYATKQPCVWIHVNFDVCLISDHCIFFSPTDIYTFVWFFVMNIYLDSSHECTHAELFIQILLFLSVEHYTVHIIQPQPIRFLRNTDNMIVIYPIRIGVYRGTSSSVLRNSHRWINNFRILNLYSTHEILPIHTSDCSLISTAIGEKNVERIVCMWGDCGCVCVCVGGACGQRHVICQLI